MQTCLSSQYLAKISKDIADIQKLACVTEKKSSGIYFCPKMTNLCSQVINL